MVRFLLSGTPRNTMHALNHSYRGAATHLDGQRARRTQTHERLITWSDQTEAYCRSGGEIGIFALNNHLKRKEAESLHSRDIQQTLS